VNDVYTLFVMAEPLIRVQRSFRRDQLDTLRGLSSSIMSKRISEAEILRKAIDFYLEKKQYLKDFPELKEREKEIK